MLKKLRKDTELYPIDQILFYRSLFVAPLHSIGQCDNDNNGNSPELRNCHLYD